MYTKKLLKSLNLLIEHIVLILCDLAIQVLKPILYIRYGKHEVERICAGSSDFNTKVTGIDKWLARSKCPEIKVFKNLCLREGSNYKKAQILELLQATPNSTFKQQQQILKRLQSMLRFLVQRDVDQVYKIILQCKQMKDASLECRKTLQECLRCIFNYKVSFTLIKCLAEVGYEQGFKDRVIVLWNNLTPALSDKRFDSLADHLKTKIDITAEQISSARWSHIGFQGDDPGTDFRGMGLLALINLLYLSERPKDLAIDLLKRSASEKDGYPFAIVGINITNALYKLVESGHMKHYYYNKPLKPGQDIIDRFNELYVELFLRFDCYWRDTEPSSILEFNQVMQMFVDVIKFLLVSRNFSLMFIY